MTGLVVAGGGFEVVVGDERVGARRLIDAAGVEVLERLAARYVRMVQSGADDGLLDVGRELFEWLDGPWAQLRALLERAGAPLVCEVAGPASPAGAEWALLRAPFELLAEPGGAFLAEDGLLRFSVARRLGQPTAPPVLDEWRLGLAFMACAPNDPRIAELDFEAEEAAILDAVGNTRLDLVVEDTGDPQQLAHRLVEGGGLPVVHLSCHGSNRWPGVGGVKTPVLVMEDEVGAARPTTAAELVRALTKLPRLMFVSACLTATAAGADGHLPPGDGHKSHHATPAGGDGLVAHSLATALVTAGVPAVLGWDGSVGDQAATLFAAELYRALARQADVAVAVGDARRVLLAADDSSAEHAAWHLARLWLGPAGGGPVVGGTEKRSLVSSVHGTKMFLDRKQQVPVAAADMFVGRRVELREALRALRSGQRAGVMVHGQGRLGKSSLAARVADRCPGYAVAVVFGDYSPLGILDAIGEAVRTNEEARDHIKKRLAQVRKQPDSIETVLIDLLAGPCAQNSGQQRPLLLIIDDLEQILTPHATGAHRVVGEHAGTLGAVLRAFNPAYTDSRLLITSRFTFDLDGLQQRLEAVQLPPLSVVAQRKLQRRQEVRIPGQRQVERSALANRARVVSSGNPGLQDLIGLRLVYGESVPLQRAEAAVTAMETYLHRGDLPDDQEVRQFLENLAIDTLLREAGTANQALLQATTVFHLPVPESVIDQLARQVGGSVGRLRGFGLLDPYPDRYQHTNPALAINPLVAGRIPALNPSERAAVAVAAVGTLLAAWGGPHAARDPILDWQLTQLALLAHDATTIAATASGAVTHLRTGPAAAALNLGQQAIDLLDRHHHPVPIPLLRRVADASFTSGDGDAGDALLARATSDMKQTGPDSIEPLEQARVTTDYARRMITTGHLDQAQQLLQHAHGLFTTAGSEQEAAVAMGAIADIAYQRGEYDEALRIYHGVALPAFERLGDTRSVAVTWGQIADIAYERGEYDEALRIYHGVALPAYERLGDTRMVAVTWGQIADIAYERGEFDEALRIYREVALPAYERLGDTRMVAVTWGQIADIAYRRGEYDEAAALQHSRLEVDEALGNLDGVASANWGLAQIALVQQDYESANPHLMKAFQLLLRLQRPDGIAVVGAALGGLMLAADAHDQAKEVLQLSLTAAAKIGREQLVSDIRALLDRLPEGDDKE